MNFIDGRVCYKHFKPGTKASLSVEEGLANILEEFCGEYWTSVSAEDPKSKKRQRLASEDEEGPLPNKKAAQSSFSARKERNQCKPTESDASSSLDSNESLLSFMDRVWISNDIDKIEEASKALIRSSLIASIVTGAVCQVVCRLVDRLDSRVSCRPSLKSALETLESLEIPISCAQIASLSGFSEKTVKQAQTDLEEVRYTTELYLIRFFKNVADTCLKERSTSLNLKDDASFIAEQQAQTAVEKRERRSRHPAKNRDKLSSPLQAALRDWCSDNTPINSGSLDHSHLKYSTLTESYEHYKEDEKGEGNKFLSFSGFCARLYNWSIKPLPYDKHACPICYSLFSTFKSASEIENDPLQIDKGVMLSIYHDQVTDLRKGDDKFVIMIMDYSRVHELGAASEETDESASELSVLNFTVITAGNNEHRFDFFALKKQGHLFMKTSMEKLAALIKPIVENRSIKLWSDGGLKTYGTVSNVHWLSQQLRVPIIYHYFPPYHGHSRCDAHFGRGKQTLRARYPSGGLNSRIQVLETFAPLGNTIASFINFPNDRQEGSWTDTFGVKKANLLYFKFPEVPGSPTVQVGTVSHASENLDEVFMTAYPIPVWRSKAPTPGPPLSPNLDPPACSNTSD